MPKKVSYVYGNGGHARAIASFLNDPVYFLVEGEPQNEREIKQTEFENNHLSYSGEIFIGIGDNKARKKIFDRIAKLGREIGTIIAPTAYVSADAEIGPGCVICAGAVVANGSKLGKNVIVNTLSSIDHDCKVGDHAQISVGVSIAGSVTIGKNVFIGLKSGVAPNITIGDNSVVRAGSVVLRSVADNTTVSGIPARSV